MKLLQLNILNLWQLRQEILCFTLTLVLVLCWDIVLNNENNVVKSLTASYHEDKISNIGYFNMQLLPGKYMDPISIRKAKKGFLSSTASV